MRKNRDLSNDSVKSVLNFSSTNDFSGFETEIINKDPLVTIDKIIGMIDRVQQVCRSKAMPLIDSRQCIGKNKIESGVLDEINDTLGELPMINQPRILQLRTRDVVYGNKIKKTISKSYCGCWETNRYRI